ncbi:MAG: protein kinase [Myxococcaceae bacterium]|nr:protein kinase [Myxococcaceae bacterium]
MGSAKPASDFDRGRLIGKYEILTRLSMGGMAELYLAFLPGPGGFKKFVAVKQILPDVKRDEAFVKMFLDEARITAAFSHANIGQVFDLGEDPQSGELYLAMEFIAGQNLEQVLKRAAKKELPVPTGFAARIIRDTALALHYAHHFTEPSTGMAMPVVHRDISPKNVMITYTGDVKVIDFGIAKARGRLNRTQVGIVKGTSGYMAPEQVKNEKLDGRADLFATAVMLHEMLCGERLFTAPTDAAMMLKIVEGEAQPPAAVNPYVSEQLSNVVLKGLTKDRNRRFATGKEFARAIEQSCPDMFEEEQVAEFMKQLFDDKIALTRSILDLANEAKDASSLSRAVEGLKEEEQETPSGGRKKITNGAGMKNVATPSPRPGLKTPGASSQRLPKVGTKGASSQKLPQVGTKGASSQKLPKVGESRRSLAPIEDEPTGKKSKPSIDQTLPPTSKGKSNGKGVVPVDLNQRGTEQGAPGPASGGSKVATIAIAVLVVAFLGGGTWAVTKGPLAGLLGPAEDPPPVNTGPSKIDLANTNPSGPKPQWLIEKEEQDRKIAEEKARQKEIEEAASDPDRLALLQEITAQIEQLNRLEEEQRQLKIEARQGKKETEKNAKKIDQLEKQINELKEALKEKEERKKTISTTRKRSAPSDEPPVAPKSAKLELGYLTLKTVNPSSASVFLGKTELGSTPLVKLPLEAGVHELRIIDSDSKNRSFTVTITANKTEEKIVNVGSLPLGP